MKINDYMVGRNEGMEYALKIVKSGGIEALENECKFRSVTNLPTQITRKYADKMIEKIKLNTIDTLLIMSLYVLRDEYEFGNKRLLKFKERFMSKTECLIEDYVNWDDIRQALEEEIGISLSIRENK